MSTPTSSSRVRAGRRLAMGFAAVFLAAAFNSANASAQTTPVASPLPLPLPCDSLAPAPRCLPPVPTSTVRCHDWSVEPVRAVGGGPHLLVSALCAVRGGERVQLRRHNPQGFNPTDLLLELVVARSPFPPGPATHEERIINVEPDAGYTSVTILPDGPSLRVDGSA